jgi:hypothetical protein
LTSVSTLPQIVEPKPKTEWRQQCHERTACRSAQAQHVLHVEQAGGFLHQEARRA